MPVDTSPKSATFTYLDGAWLAGNPPIIGPTSHAFWMSSTVFDGARWFDGTAPDLLAHCQRLNASARTMGLAPLHAADEIARLALEGVGHFDGKTALYIKPMYWAEHGIMGLVQPDPASTRFALCLFEAPMNHAKPIRLSLSPYRRPTPESAPTEAKAGCLYPNNARMMAEARNRGFDTALALDQNGNVAEAASANVFLVRDGIVKTPQPNRTFLAGITRARVIGLLRAAGHVVEETTLVYRDFLEADEVFTTGNYSKVSPVIALDERTYQQGPVAAEALALYMAFARESAARG